MSHNGKYTSIHPYSLLMCSRRCTEGKVHGTPLSSAVTGIVLMGAQSKDKFLSAASSDGFGFCSVILYDSFQRCSNHLIRSHVWLAAVDGTYTMRPTPKNSLSRTERMGTAIFWQSLTCRPTVAYLGRTMFHSSSFPSSTRTPSSLSALTRAERSSASLTKRRAKAGNVMQAASMRSALSDTLHHFQLTALSSTSNSKVGPSNLSH